MANFTSRAMESTWNAASSSRRTLALLVFGGLLATLAESWNRFYGQQYEGPLGWQTGGGPFISSILVTGAVVAVTLVGVRLLRYPLSQPAGPGPAATEGLAATGPASTLAPEPAVSARAS